MDIEQQMKILQKASKLAIAVQKLLDSRLTEVEIRIIDLKHALSEYEQATFKALQEEEAKINKIELQGDKEDLVQECYFCGREGHNMAEVPAPGGGVRLWCEMGDCRAEFDVFDRADEAYERHKDNEI